MTHSSQVEQMSSAARDSRSRFQPWHLSRISPAEKLVIFAVVAGMNNAEIAKSLFLTQHTIKTKIYKLLRKFDLHYRAELVVLAYEVGIFRPGWAGRQLDLHQVKLGRDHFPFQRKQQAKSPEPELDLELT
ncbi:response regulator transcription factor [Saccharopolyspora sp. ASAGF58]|uniref:response regulator transcription factor n=1 Tax=Saccharopolyspora sp. ASAGF58 TaxID=2719023 RepID=UPI00143FBF57|nr:helix-turn-helix transcriptional regulator [Saccharopolyspora sp. ASAGF58]QIZ37925.1 helix-turn-helix transcriptional regulator [Saccharopolyspora sp. ASAGF58]